MPLPAGGGGGGGGDGGGDGGGGGGGSRAPLGAKRARAPRVAPPRGGVA